jgi:hypothetical protein
MSGNVENVNERRERKSMTDYELLLSKVGADFAEGAAKMLGNEGFSNMSLEAQLAFIQGFKSAVSVWTVIPQDALAQSFSAVIGVAGMNLKTKEGEES